MNLQNKISEILDKHPLMTLATVTAEGLPKARSVDFARDSETFSKLYFMTFKTSEKVAELANNQNAYIVVDYPADSMEELAQVQYIKASALVDLVTKPEEAQKAMGLIIQKYPYLKDLPGDPSMMSLYAVNMKKITLTDNTQGFGHTDIIEVE